MAHYAQKVLLGTILLMSAFWPQAQEGSPGADVWISANTYPPTVEGCLRSFSLRYAVVAEDGTVYKLTGGTARLRPYVGHEVEISGQPTVESLPTSMQNAASTVQELPALGVRSTKVFPRRVLRREPLAIDQEELRNDRETGKQT